MDGGAARSTSCTAGSTTACWAPSGRPSGQSLDVLLTEAVRAGRLGLVNVPGNGLADDVATYAWVPAMIRLLPRRGAAAGLGPAPGCWPTTAQWARGPRPAARAGRRGRSPATAGGARWSAAPARPRSSAGSLQAEVRPRPTASWPGSRWRPATLPDPRGRRAAAPDGVDLRVFSVAGRSAARPARAADPRRWTRVRAWAAPSRRQQGHLAPAAACRQRPCARPSGLLMTTVVPSGLGVGGDRRRTRSSAWSRGRGPCSAPARATARSRARRCARSRSPRTPTVTSTNGSVGSWACSIALVAASHGGQQQVVGLVRVDARRPPAARAAARRSTGIDAGSARQPPPRPVAAPAARVRWWCGEPGRPRRPVRRRRDGPVPAWARAPRPLSGTGSGDRARSARRRARAPPGPGR